MNISFSIGELILFCIIVKPHIFIQTELLIVILFIISIILAVLLYFFIGSLLGLVGFWSPEVWAPRFIFYIVTFYFAGGLFPLDIFPEPIFSFFKLLPFTYLVYFPVKVFLGQLPITEILQGFSVMIVWIGLLYLLLLYVWKKGLTIYGSEGR